MGIAGRRCRGQMQAARNFRSRAICGSWRMRGRKSQIAARRTGDAVLPLNLFTNSACKLIALLKPHAFIVQASDLQHTRKHRVCNPTATTAGDSGNLSGLGCSQPAADVPNRRCLRATITFLLACQVYVCVSIGQVQSIDCTCPISDKCAIAPGNKL